MKKILSILLGLTMLLCGCYHEETKSYFYELNDSDNKKKIDAYYFIDINKSDDYSIYINYFVEDMDKWSDTIDLIREESRTEKYKSSISIFDDNHKLIYSATEYPLRLHSHSSTDRIISVSVFPKYFYLEKGKRYYFKIDIDNLNLSAINGIQKQVEITVLYKSK